MIAIAASDTAHAKTYRVRHYTPGVLGETGLSWAAAFNTIEGALAEAELNSGDDIILVARSAPGTAWKPGLTIGAWGTITSGIPSSNSTFTIQPGNDGKSVNLRGGFVYDANGGSDDWSTTNAPTVLSGDLDGNDNALTGSVDDNSNQSNAYHVVTVLDVNAKTVIDDFIIERGNSGEQTMPPVIDNFPDGRGGGGVVLTSHVQLDQFGDPFTGWIAEPVIQNCTIQLNYGNGGGGLLATRSKPATSTTEALPTVHIWNCTIRANLGNDYGGGIRVKNGSIDVVNSLIIDNTAAPYGGGVYVTAGTNTVPPAAARASAKFVHCTTANNSAGFSGAGIYWCNLTRTSSMILDSSIIALNGPAPSDQTSQFTGDVDIVTISHCAFPISFASSHTYDPEIFDVQDPYFDNANDSAILNRTYRVHPCSPIRDRGEPVAANLPVDIEDVDHDGDMLELLPDREFGDRVLDSDAVTGARTDIGAIEHADEPICVGDANLDGVVDATDLGILLGSWNFPTPPPPAAWAGCDIAQATTPTPCLCLDRNRDGFINSIELGELFGAWGNFCDPWPPQPPNNMMQTGGEDSEEATEAAMTPTDLAWLFEFSSTDELAEWLGTLSPEARLEVLSMLGGS